MLGIGLLSAYAYSFFITKKSPFITFLWTTIFVFGILHIPEGAQKDCLIISIVFYCIQNQIITVENEAWFRYVLDKRVSTLFVFIPCTLLAIHLSDS